MFQWLKSKFLPDHHEDDDDVVEVAQKTFPAPNYNLRGGMWVVTPDDRVGILTDPVNGEVTHTDAQGNNIMEILDGKMVIKKTFHAPLSLRQAKLEELPNRPMQHPDKLRDRGYM